MPTLVNKPRILIVEDEAIVARDIQLQLLEMGYESAGHATRGEQAIAMIGERRPDLVLMDIQLAGAMDGIAAAEVIRAQYAVPVVFLTAFASDDLLTRAKLAEPFGYVLKPFSERELRTVLEMALYKHQAESKLRENEARFRTLVDWSPEAIAVHRDGILLYVNPAAIRLFGAASATDMLGKHLRDRVHPDDHSGLQARLDDISIQSDTSPMVRHRLLKLDGAAIDTEINATSISYDGAPARHLMIRDITVRKRAEEMQSALHQISEAAHLATDLPSLFPRIHEIIGELMPAKNFYVALYDEASDELSFPYFIDEFDPVPAPRLLKDRHGLTETVLRSGAPLLLTPDSMQALSRQAGVEIIGTMSVDWLGVPLMGSQGPLGALVVQSYTGVGSYSEKDKELLHFVSAHVAAAIERAQALQYVMDSEERFHSVFEQSPVSMALSTYPEGLVVEVNTAATEIFGYSRDEIVGRTSTELNAWVDQEERQQFLDMLRKNGVVKNFDADMRRRDGGILHILHHANLVTQGQQLFTFNSMMDVTERKLAEAAVRESEGQFKSAFDNSAIGMALVGLDGRFLKVNASLCAIVGYAEDELLRRTFQDITHPDDLAANLSHLQKLFAGETHGYKMETRYFHRNGSIVHVLLAVSVAKDKAGRPKHYISQIEDISERKRAEEWQQHYADTLGMIMAEAPIADVLESLVLFVERQGDGMLCSILLLSADGKRLEQGAAPSLPTFYSLAINGVEIGPDAGSCGAAAYASREVVAEDVMTHPCWIPWRELAAQAGLRSCWSLPIFSSGSKVLGTFAVYRDEPSSPDAQERELIQQSSALAAVALEHAQHQEDRRLAKVVFEQSIEGIMVTDSAHRILMVNESFESLTGYSAVEVVGLPPNILDSGHYDPSLHQMMNESMADNGRWRGELWGRRKTGDIYPLSMSVATVRDSNGAPSHFINIIADISDSKVQAARIERLAFYDTLTGLPNRALFLDRLEQILANSKRHGGHGVILFLDLDRFKEINDSQGHAVGDLALAEVARRLQGAVRQEETLARLGGDEFVLIAESADHYAAVQIAGRLQDSLLEPLDLLGNAYSVGASIGIAFYPADGTSTEDLLKHTDIAMYHAKVGGGGGYRLYQSAMGDELEKRLNVAHRLARAIETGVLQLYYQPQIDLADNRVIGAEALLRWDDPLLGWISPGEFIPIAEERGMMAALGDWVLAQACRQINAWAEAGLRLNGKLAINVSARQLEAPGMVERMLDIVRAANLKPERFELEITETTMMVDPERAVKVMEWLNAEGFALSIDDFGTGYSSLAYLKRFAASQIKIDISFVRNMLTDANDYAIVSTIITMARSLGLHTTAEGVEEAEQAAALRALGCNFAQGYYFGRPEPAQSFMQKWLGSPPVS